MIGTSNPCGRYLPGLPPRRCEGVRYEYRTSSYRDGGRVPVDVTCTDEHPFYARHLGRRWDNERRRYQYVAERKCLACGEVSRVDVAYEVPRVIKTPEAWAEWWARIDAT
jgi:hypothetical protein